MEHTTTLPTDQLVDATHQLVQLVATFFDDAWSFEQIDQPDPTDHDPESGHFTVVIRADAWQQFVAAAELFDAATRAVIDAAGLDPEGCMLVHPCARYSGEHRNVSAVLGITSNASSYWSVCSICGNHRDSHDPKAL